MASTAPRRFPPIMDFIIWGWSQNMLIWNNLWIFSGKNSGYCYQRVVNDYCVDQSSSNTTKHGCCCSKESPAGWGSLCERCPSRQTRELHVTNSWSLVIRKNSFFLRYKFLLFGEFITWTRNEVTQLYSDSLDYPISFSDFYSGKAQQSTI